MEEETERENVGYESDVAEEMISAMVKLAKETVESDKLRIEDESGDEDMRMKRTQTITKDPMSI